MPKAHNKKRNAGLIFEQLVQYISDAIINENHDGALSALNIIRKRFVPGSELYKEFRLFNALIKTKVSSSALALRILSEARNASKSHDRNKLRKEKSLLIRDINYQLKDSNLYSRRVSDYRNYATIQTLLNEWRKEDRGDLKRLIHYEEKICQWMNADDQSHKSTPINNSQDVDSLTVKIMTEKFNGKYGKSLNSEQRDLIREYVFSLGSHESSSFISGLSIIKKQTLNELTNFKACCDNIVLNEKIDDVLNKIHELDFSNLTDDIMGRFLMLSRIKEELMEKVNG